MGILPAGKTGQILVVDASTSALQDGANPLAEVLAKLAKDTEIVRLKGRCREQASGNEFSALVLYDWKADRQGIELLSEARASARDAPIVVVGLPGRQNDSIAAYEWGADNYFEFSGPDSAVLARLRRLIKRQPKSNQSISVSDLQVWADSGIAFRSGKPIKLSGKEKDLLLYLVANRSRPVTRAEILKNVFGLSFEPGTNIVEVHIHRLRRKIDGGSTQRLLNTIRGSGYVLGDYSNDTARRAIA